MITNLDGDEVGTRKGPKEGIPPRMAMVTFAVLFAMNLLDYLDRNILTAVLPQLKADKIVATNLQAGACFTYFLISYSLVSPIMGWLGDRWRRTWLLGMGVGLWSLATVGTAFARDYQHLVLARALLGVGEATYGVIAPTILMDLFARERRARVFSAFYLAMPIGSALGLGLGATIATHWGWRMAFLRGRRAGPDRGLRGVRPPRAGPGGQRRGRPRSAQGAREGRGARARITST